MQCRQKLQCFDNLCYLARFSDHRELCALLQGGTEFWAGLNTCTKCETTDPTKDPNQKLTDQKPEQTPSTSATYQITQTDQRYVPFIVLFMKLKMAAAAQTPASSADSFLVLHLALLIIIIIISCDFYISINFNALQFKLKRLNDITHRCFGWTELAHLDHLAYLIYPECIAA